MIGFKQHMTEVFDKPMPFKWEAKTNQLWSANFDIEGKLYKVIIRKKPLEVVTARNTVNKIDIWETVFMAYVDAPSAIGWTTMDTDTGNSIKVFSTVFGVMKDFLSKHKDEPFVFVTHEESRKRLYGKMAKKIIKLLPSGGKHFINDGSYVFNIPEHETI